LLLNNMKRKITMNKKIWIMAGIVGMLFTLPHTNAQAEVGRTRIEEGRPHHEKKLNKHESRHERERARREEERRLRHKIKSRKHHTER